ncbi:helix-turn-helix domain-containing protein [Streptomyces sp. NPDC054787]
MVVSGDQSGTRAGTSASAYFDTGCVAAAAAPQLSLKVRALTYRLKRIRTLTGRGPSCERRAVAGLRGAAPSWAVGKRAAGGRSSGRGWAPGTHGGCLR